MESSDLNQGDYNQNPDPDTDHIFAADFHLYRIQWAQLKSQIQFFGYSDSIFQPFSSLHPSLSPWFTFATCFLSATRCSVYNTAIYFKLLMITFDLVWSEPGSSWVVWQLHQSSVHSLGNTLHDSSEQTLNKKLSFTLVCLFDFSWFTKLYISFLVHMPQSQQSSLPQGNGRDLTKMPMYMRELH